MSRKTKSKLHFDTVLTRNVLGEPVAMALVTSREAGKTTVYVVLSFEQRRELDAIHDSMVGKREGLAWTGPTFLVRDRRYESGEEISLEIARGGWTNAETQAVDVSNVIGKLPQTLFVGDPTNPKPASGMNWREATLMRLLQLAAEMVR